MNVHVAKTAEVVVPIIMFDDRYFLLVADRGTGEDRWRYPSTRVAEGETLRQAAARAAWFKLGLMIAPERFGNTIRSMKVEKDVTLHSVRANLTADEFARLADVSPTGAHSVITVEKSEIKRFLPHKRDRRLMNAGS